MGGAWASEHPHDGPTRHLLCGMDAQGEPQCVEGVNGSHPGLTQPVATQRRRPIYPRRWRSLGVPGKVVLNFSVSDIGDVYNLILESAEPDAKDFVNSAMIALRRTKFKAGTVDGQAVHVHGVGITYRFDLYDN